MQQNKVDENVTKQIATMRVAVFLALLFLVVCFVKKTVFISVDGVLLW